MANFGPTSFRLILGGLISGNIDQVDSGDVALYLAGKRRIAKQGPCKQT